jgi:hypothetical protein
MHDLRYAAAQRLPHTGLTPGFPALLPQVLGHDPTVLAR